jgi:hypothetical protein
MMTVAATSPDNRISFITHCTQCKIEVWPLFDKTELLQLLESGAATFYCISCDNHWKPTEQERENLTKYVKEKITKN